MHVQNHNNNFINVQSSIVHHIRLAGYQPTRGGEDIGQHTHTSWSISLSVTLFSIFLSLCSIKEPVDPSNGCGCSPSPRPSSFHLCVPDLFLISDLTHPMGNAQLLSVTTPKLDGGGRTQPLWRKVSIGTSSQRAEGEVSRGRRCVSQPT